MEPLMATEAPSLSIIIPTLNEVRSITHLVGDLRGLPLAHEIIVADGGSIDGTGARAMQLGARVVISPPGRGIQLARGARAACAPMLCFLHADVRLDRAAVIALYEVATTTTDAAHVFRLQIDDVGRVFRVIEWGANARTRWLGLPYGDQGLIVTRAAYEAAGGYPELPLMEDVAFIRALRRVTPIRLLDAAITVSARRWRRDGVVRRTTRNWAFLVAFLAGVPAVWMAARYRAHRDEPPP